MKNRVVPYGYKFNLGEYVINEDEVIVIHRVIKMYLKGNSMNDITKALNSENIPFFENQVWNKPKVMRLLDDKRYLGNEQFPQIIDEQIYNQLKDVRSSKCSQVIGISEDRIHLGVPAICDCCGAEMIYRHDRDIKLPHTFRCDKCGNRGKYTDETFFPIVNGIINSIIAHPEILNSYNEINLSTDVVRTQNEINRAIDSGEYSDEFGEEIMNFISSLYECIDSNTYLTEKIKRIVSEMECINEFNKELFEQIVKNIIIKNDGDIEINLINNQILGKEIIEYGRNSETKCSLHTGNNKACDGPRYERQGVESGSLLSCIDQNGRTA